MRRILVLVMIVLAILNTIVVFPSFGVASTSVQPDILNMHRPSESPTALGDSSASTSDQGGKLAPSRDIASSVERPKTTLDGKSLRASPQVGTDVKQRDLTNDKSDLPEKTVPSQASQLEIATVAPLSSTTTLFTEGFEGAFPSTNWWVGDDNANGGYDYWDDVNHRAYSGSWSGWCAAVGTKTDGTPNTNTWTYDHNMQAYLSRNSGAPFDARNWDIAFLTYNAWYNTETSFDHLDLTVTGDGSNWGEIFQYRDNSLSDSYGDWTLTGNSNGWQYRVGRVPETTSAGSAYTSSFNIGYYFQSDGSVWNEGVYLDDISFTVYDISFDYVSLDTSYVSPGSTLQLGYEIDNVSPYTLSIWLGATLTDPYGTQINDPAHDIIVYVPGYSHQYWYRSFDVPSWAQPGYYDVTYAIWSGFTSPISSSRQWFTFTWSDCVEVRLDPSTYDEYFWSCACTSSDSNGDGANEAIEARMDVDTSYSGSLGVTVIAHLYVPGGSYVDSDYPSWTITSTQVEYAYANLHVPDGSPEGWYDVGLYLYDQWNNYEDYYYCNDALYWSPAGCDEHFYDPGFSYSGYDNDGDSLWDSLAVSMDVDTTYSSSLSVSVNAYLIDPYGGAADSDSPAWTISGHAIEYGVAYLHVPPGGQEGWYDVQLYLYDQWVNYEDYRLVENVVYLYPPSTDEYFYSVTYSAFDSDGDGFNDALDVIMDVDTTSTVGLGVQVFAYLIDPNGVYVVLDSASWTIGSGGSLEYGHAFLYVPDGSPEGWYDVELYLYDQWGIYEDYQYGLDVAYLYPPNYIQTAGWFWDAWLENVVDNDGDGYYGVIDLCWDADTNLVQLTIYVDIYARFEDGSAYFITQTDPYTIYASESDTYRVPLSDGATGLWDFRLELYDWTTGALLDVLDYGEDSSITDVPMDQDDTTPLVKDWTFMVYLDADNNLEQYGITIFLEMASVGSTSDVNVVVQMDRISGYDSSYDDWTDCRRFYVTSGMTPTAANSIQALGEVNMGDPNTLAAFINWAVGRYPATNYCLVIYDHGSGCVQMTIGGAVATGVCFDDTDGDLLTLPELDQAFSASVSRMQLVFFDACDMGMLEVAYQIRNYADVMVGTEEVGWTPGPYGAYLSSLTGNPSMSPSDFAMIIVNDYISWVAPLTSTMSAVDLAQISELATVTSSFGQLLISKENLYHDQIHQARLDTEGYEGPYLGYYGYYIDLFHFAELVYSYVPDGELASLAVDVMNAVSNAVIVSGQNSHPNSHGLSVFFPEDTGRYYQFEGAYLGTAFAADSQWDEFVEYHLTYVPTDEYLWSIHYTAIDSDGDGLNDGLDIAMDVDTSSSVSVYVEVSAYLYNLYGESVSSSSSGWTIGPDGSVEYGHAYLYLPEYSPEGWCDVELFLYDQGGNYEDYEYGDDVAYLYPPNTDEYYWGIAYNAFDSDGDGVNDALDVVMDVDTSSSASRGVQVVAYLIDPYGIYVGSDNPIWTIGPGGSVEYGHAYLYVPTGSPEGYYDVELILYDQWINYEDYRYGDDVLYFSGAGVWDVGLTASLGSYNDISLFGVRNDATDGFDAAYDQVDPPAPPTGVVSYFYYPDNTPPPPVDYRRLSTSRIAPSDSMMWTYRLMSVGLEGAIAITWNGQIANIPLEYGVYLQCPDGTIINMRTATGYSFYAAMDTTYTFTVMVGGCTCELQLFTGWNMVSFACLPEDTSFSSILSGVGYYQVLTWDGASYITPTNAEAGRGYWILVLADTVVQFYGMPVVSYELDLPAGWSMIGSIYGYTVNPGLVFPGYYQLLTWNGASYVTATSIESWKGYWVLVLEPTHIVVDESSSMGSQLSTNMRSLSVHSESETEWDVALTASAGGYSDVSELGIRSDATDGFDAAYDQLDPPAPPTGAVSHFYYPDNTPPPPIDYRKLSTSKIALSSTMIWTYKVKLVSLDGTLVISWTSGAIAAIPLEYSVHFLGSGVDVNMRMETEYSFTAESDVTYTFTVQVQLEGMPAVLAVRGTDNGIYYRLHSLSDSWSDWYALPGATCDSPAVALLGGNAHFVVRGSDGSSLWHGYVNLNTLEFSGWTWISGSTPSAPTLTSDGTVLCLVVRGSDDGIYYRFYSLGTWGSWLRISDGSTCDTPAATLVGNNLHIVVRSMDGSSLWHRAVTYDGISVKSWTLIGGGTDERPVMVAYALASYLYLSVKGLDGGIYFQVYDLIQETWYFQWIPESGATCDGPAIAIHNNQLLVAVRGADENSLWHEHLNAVPWNVVVGSSPSEPTLAAPPV